MQLSAGFKYLGKLLILCCFVCLLNQFLNDFLLEISSIFRDLNFRVFIINFPSYGVGAKCMPRCRRVKLVFEITRKCLNLY